MRMTNRDDRRRLALFFVSLGLTIAIALVVFSTALRLAVAPSAQIEPRATPAAIRPLAAGVRDLVPARRA